LRTSAGCWIAGREPPDAPAVLNHRDQLAPFDHQAELLPAARDEVASCALLGRGDDARKLLNPALAVGALPADVGDFAARIATRAIDLERIRRRV
jgi:hypothetical protein